MRGIANNADVEAIEAQGEMQNLPASTYDMLREAAARHPQAPALSFFLRAEDHARPESWNYQAFFAQINRTANFFHNLGANKDSVIAFVLPNLPETHFVIWGGQAAGITLAINPLLKPQAIAKLLDAAKASILITLAPFPGTDIWQKLQPVLHTVTSLRHVVLVDLADRVRGIKGVAVRLMRLRERWRSRDTSTTEPTRTYAIHDFGRCARRQPADRLLSGRRFDPEDFSSFFCTGGTTGTPKIAMRRHRNEVANAWSVAQFLGQGIGPGKNVFCGLPLFHVNGVLVTGLLPFSKGAHVLLGTPQGYRGKGVIENFWAMVERHRIHFFSAVPTLYGALLGVPRKQYCLDSLEYGLCGAAPMPRELMNRFQDETGIKILEGYGLTEGTCVSSVNPPLGERRAGSVGLRVPGQDMRIVQLGRDGNYLREALVGESGVLAISGPNVFAGYMGSQQSEGLWLNLGDGKRWLHTGDLAYRDAQGYFWLTGRTKELIIRGGHNIDPSCIEQPLYDHPAVQLAAAVGRPDAYAGEVPVAYVQLKRGHQATAEELLAHVSKHVGERAATPKAIFFTDDMPLTAVGKIHKPALKRLQIESVLSEALADAHIAIEFLQLREGEGGEGLSVDVGLVHPHQAISAKEALGRYPFPIHVCPRGVA
ncbi:acyl-CoA synthetase [Dyella sp. BiH032]|uniref:acyl-CoA synthetase n=1 Tax=Dyella sp. BiH032 TaxID=3075430 RepID=UPI0028932620|nr:acyl-CoA synthetase [Dyella sp. BiH032]WNL44596.1 acyl-CoA synthetase [Dyella sp. BiH032]